MITGYYCFLHKKRHKSNEIRDKYFSLSAFINYFGLFLGKNGLDTYNHFHNNLRLFDVLRNFSFITSETMCDYYL